MSNKIIVKDLSGLTMRACLLNDQGEWWNSTSETFEAYNSANLSDYEIALTETGNTGVYLGTFPSAVSAGAYVLLVGSISGAVLQEADLSGFEAGSLVWTGTDVLDGQVDVKSLALSPMAASNVKSVFTGTGAADDVDLSIRSLTVHNDTGVAVYLVSDLGNALECIGRDAGLLARSTSQGPAVWLQGVGGVAGRADLVLGGTGTIETSSGDLVPVNSTQISGSATTADTLEAYADRLVYLDASVDDVLKAVYDIGVASASVGMVASDYTIVDGSEGGDFANTHTLDGTYHSVTAAVSTGTATPNVIDVQYDFDLGGVYVPVAFHVKGRLHEGSQPGGRDSVTIQVRNWEADSWDTIVPPNGGFTGVANSDPTDDSVIVIPLFPRHRQDGTNLIRIRFYGDSLLDGTTLYIDKASVTYTSVCNAADIAQRILANPDNPLQTDSSGYALADTVLISGSDMAADNVKSVFTGQGASDNVDLSARSLTISNPTGDAVTFSSLAGAGFVCGGSTYGIYAIGGVYDLVLEDGLLRDIAGNDIAVQVSGYGDGEDPGSYVLVNPAYKIVTDDTGSVQADVQKITGDDEVATALANNIGNLDAAVSEVPSLVFTTDMSDVENSAPEHSLCTLVMAGLESSINGTTWTIRKTDGTTLVEKTVTTRANAKPITGVS